MLTSLWEQLIKPPIEIIYADENIKLWDLIYKGNADWLAYEYKAVDGRCL